MIDINKILLRHLAKVSVKTSSAQLNNLLSGGLYANMIYHVYGPPSSGKTCFALDLAYNTEDIILYVNFDHKPITSTRENLLVVSPQDLKELNEVLAEFKGVGIPVAAVVIDSLPSVFLDYAAKTKQPRTNTFKLLMSVLLRHIHKLGKPALVFLNQIRADIFNPISNMTYATKNIINATCHVSLLFMLHSYMDDGYRVVDIKLEQDEIKHTTGITKILINSQGFVSAGYSDYVEKVLKNVHMSLEPMEHIKAIDHPRLS